jgi:hypothetical protein
LSNLDYNAEPQQVDFTIRSFEEGDIIEGLDFVLNYNEIIQAPVIDSLPQINTVQDSIAQPENVLLIDQHKQNTIVWGILCTQPGYYYVQCGAFWYESYALRMAMYINQNTDMAVGIAMHNGFFKVRVACVPTRREAVEIKKRLLEIRVSDDLFVVIKE